MTIREKLLENISEEDSNLPLNWFLFGISGLLIGLMNNLLSRDFHDVTINGQEFKGKAKLTATAPDFIQVLNGTDMLRHTNLFMNFSQFIKWYLSQEVDTDWFELSVLASKWNEFFSVDREV